MSLNSRFLKDPAEFAQRFALNPQGNRSSQLANAVDFNAADLKVKALGAGSSFLQVQGANRTLYCNIVQGGVQSDDAALRCDTRHDGNLCRMELSPTPQSGSAFPVFWLPWQANKATRIMLKTSKHETKTSGFVRPTTVQPVVFLTAALSGCSIFVEGDRDQPIVYHLNAAATSPGALDLADPTLPARVDNKLLAMENLYRQASTSAHTKLPATQQGTRVADMSMYLGAQLSAPGEQQRLAQARRQLPLHANALPVVNPTNANVKNVHDVDTLMTYGTVFGKKGGDGLWTFYHQSRTRATYWAKANPALPDNVYANWVKRDQWVAISCREFWPNGARQIQR